MSQQQKMSAETKQAVQATIDTMLAHFPNNQARAIHLNRPWNRHASVQTLINQFGLTSQEANQALLTALELYRSRAEQEKLQAQESEEIRPDARESFRVISGGKVEASDKGSAQVSVNPNFNPRRFQLKIVTDEQLFNRHRINDRPRYTKPKT